MVIKINIFLSSINNIKMSVWLSDWKEIDTRLALIVHCNKSIRQFKLNYIHIIYRREIKLQIFLVKFNCESTNLINNVSIGIGHNMAI